MNKVKKVFAAVVIVAAFAVLAAAGIAVMPTEHSEDGFAMDTVVSVRVKAKDSEQLTAKTLELISALADKIDRFSKKSEIYAANEAHTATKIDSGVYDIIDEALEVCKKTDGAFDITMGFVSDAWKFNSGTVAVPDEETLAAALEGKGYQKLTLSGGTVTVPEGMALDLGSVGKGAACDAARSFLEENGAKSTVLSVGGSILLMGKNDYTVGIRNPYGSVSDYAAVLTLRDTCVSTSGSYERFIELNGVRYHHLLDTSTGMPAENGLVSVSVVCRSGELSDALSTACFVLGLEKGAQLAEACGAQAVFITADKTVYITDGLKGHIEITGEGFNATEIEHHTVLNR